MNRIHKYVHLAILRRSPFRASTAQPLFHSRAVFLSRWRNLFCNPLFITAPMLHTRTVLPLMRGTCSFCVCWWYLCCCCSSINVRNACTPCVCFMFTCSMCCCSGFGAKARGLSAFIVIALNTCLLYYKQMYEISTKYE